MPVGVFDSGVGGLGVLTEIRRNLENADLLYLADQHYAPYGVRSLEDLRLRCRLVTGWLVDRGCEVVTIACNTASAAALWDLREAFPSVRFVGMEPAVKPAVGASYTGRVGVVATAATFQSELFASVVDRFAAGTDVLTAACPRWVELVEKGTTDGPEAVAAVTECVAPLLAAGVDVLVLACTHFPELGKVIRQVVGNDILVVDPAAAVARQTAKVSVEVGAACGRAGLELVTTSDPEGLTFAARRHGLSVSATPLTLQ